MFSPWAILLYVGALHAALVVLLSVPLPRWISTRLLALTEKLFYYQLVLVALCLIAAGSLSSCSLLLCLS